jgi:hypothetical protein
MPHIDGETLRTWRRSRGWDVPETARRLRHAAADGQVPVHDALVRMIWRWERLGLKTERYELLYRALGFDDAQAFPPGASRHEPGGDLDAADEARDVMSWVNATNTSDDAIAEMARAASYLAEAHTRVAARKILPEVLGVHQAVQALLLDGRQRLRQTRDLLRIDSELLAHACLLLGDLGNHQSARQCGSAALLCAQEAEADEGITWSVMAKTARWQVRFVEAAELARRGFEVSGRTPVRTALRAAATADAYWDAGAAKVTATWAQVRAGAAMAYLLKNSLDGAAAQLAPVLELPPELRIQTVTGYLHEIGGILAAPRFDGSALGVGLRQQISEFNASTV